MVSIYTDNLRSHVRSFEVKEFFDQTVEINEIHPNSIPELIYLIIVLKKFRNLHGLYFNNIDFRRNEIDISGFNFGDGGIHFKGCDLSNCTISLDGTSILGVGQFRVENCNTARTNISADHIAVESGIVFLDLTSGSSCAVSMQDARFGDGEKTIRLGSARDASITISSTNFGSGDCLIGVNGAKNVTLDLTDCEFGEGKLDLSGLSCSGSKIDLSGTSHAVGRLDLSSMRLQESSIILDDSEFASGEIDFSGSRFIETPITARRIKAPKRSLNFEDCILDHCSADFESSVFGGDAVNFSNLSMTGEENRYSTLKLSDLSFRGKNFQLSGNGEWAAIEADGLDVDCDLFAISNLKIENGRMISFSGSQISADLINLMVTVQADNIGFDGTSFEAKRLIWNGAHLDAKTIDLSNSNWNVNEFDMSDVEWKGSRLSFEDAKFSVGEMRIDRNEFSTSFTSFQNATFDVRHVEFDNSRFTGRASFANLSGVSAAKHFSFRHCVFENSFDLSATEEFGCVVDLTRTKMTNQFSLENVRCKINKEPSADWSSRIERYFGWLLHDYQIKALTEKLQSKEWIGKHRVSDKADIERLRRLKQIAGDNKNHRQALDYRVKETKAERWNGSTFVDLLIEWVFQKASDYGRSEPLVLGWMGATIFAFAWIYSRFSTTDLSGWNLAIKSLTYSLSQTLAFLPVSRTSREAYSDALFGTAETIPLAIVWIATAQNLISVLLLFLFGLAIRNRFKI